MNKESFGKLFATIAVTGLAGFSPLQAQDDDQHPLGVEMDEISGGLKSLRKLARSDNKWADSAAAIRKARGHALKSITIVPKEVEALPDGPEKAKALADSARLMGMMYAALCELELAFLNEDEEAVEVAIDKCKDIKKEGHEKYYKDE